jgi:hypothetical protein
MTNFAPTNLTSNTTPAQFTADASSNSSDAYKAFDNSSGTYWEPSTNASNEWLRIFLPFNTLVDSYSIKCPSVATHAPTDFKLQGSYDDGTNWIDMNTQSSLSSGWTDNVARLFTFTPTTSTGYASSGSGQANIGINNYYVYRLLFTSQPSAKVQISEFTLEHTDSNSQVIYSYGNFKYGTSYILSSSYGKIEYFDYKEVNRAGTITIPVGSGGGGAVRPVVGQIFPRGVPV